MAEAEADPYYAAYGYAGLPVASAYGAGAYGAGVYDAGAYGAYGAYHGPYGLAAGYASLSPSASVSINGLAPAAVPAVAGGYAGAGRYVANSAGVVHVVKREAEADPYYAAYGYAGLPVAGAYAGAPYAAAYGAYPYTAYSGYSNVSPSASLSI